MWYYWPYASLCHQKHSERVSGFRQKLIVALEHTVSQYPVRFLFRTPFLMVIHAFLRLGEITADSVKSQNCVLQSADVNFNHDGSRIEGVQIVMREYKTNKHHTPLIIHLQACSDSSYCPVQALNYYLALYKHISGPLFQTMDGLPITYSVVSSHLKAAIKELYSSQPGSILGSQYWGSDTCGLFRFLWSCDSKNG